MVVRITTNWLGIICTRNNTKIWPYNKNVPELLDFIWIRLFWELLASLLMAALNDVDYTRHILCRQGLRSYSPDCTTLLSIGETLSDLWGVVMIHPRNRIPIYLFKSWFLILIFIFTLLITKSLSYTNVATLKTHNHLS